MVFLLSALWWIRIRGLWKLPDRRDWLGGKLCLILMGRAMLSKPLIQFSVDEWGWVPSLLFDLRPNYGGGNEDSGHLLQKVPCTHCWTQCPWPCSRPPLTHASTRDSWTLTASLGQSLVGSLLPSPRSWCAQYFVCAVQESVPQSCVSSVIKSHWPPKSDFLGVLSLFGRSPDWEICCSS